MRHRIGADIISMMSAPSRFGCMRLVLNRLAILSTGRNMTPFGIRKKLKSLFLGEPIPHEKPPERPKHSVHFEMSEARHFQVEAKEGDSLVLASGRGPFPIATGCSDGTCATCQVEVLEGHDMLSHEDEKEKQCKIDNNCDPTYRLGCQAAILGPDLRVRIINVLGEDLVE